MRSISINNLFPPHTWRNLATPALTGKVLLDSGINATTLQYDFKQENHSIKVSNVVVITKTMRVRHLKTRTRTQNPKTKLCCFSLPLFPPTIYHHQSYFHILNAICRNQVLKKKVRKIQLCRNTGSLHWGGSRICQAHSIVYLTNRVQILSIVTTRKSRSCNVQPLH